MSQKSSDQVADYEYDVDRISNELPGALRNTPLEKINEYVVASRDEKLTLVPTGESFDAVRSVAEEATLAVWDHVAAVAGSLLPEEQAENVSVQTLNLLPRGKLSDGVTARWESHTFRSRYPRNLIFLGSLALPRIGFRKPAVDTYQASGLGAHINSEHVRKQFRTGKLLVDASVDMVVEADVHGFGKNHGIAQEEFSIYSWLIKCGRGDDRLGRAVVTLFQRPLPGDADAPYKTALRSYVTELQRDAPRTSFLN